MLGGMQTQTLALAAAMLMVGCDSKKSAPDQAPAKQAETAPAKQTETAARAPLVDVTSASTLAAVRTAFNAHRGEARFLTLLSPT